MGNTKKIKRIAYISVSVLLIGIIIFLSRGPYISNALKKLALPELEHMTGRKVIAQTIYLNLFPLFVEAKGLKFFDDEGQRVMHAERVKAYIGLSGLLRKELTLKRVVVKEPDMGIDSAHLDEIVNNVKQYLSKKQDRIRVVVNVIEIRDGEFSFYDTGYDALVTASKLNAEILLGDMPRLKVHIKELVPAIKNFQELRLETDATLFFKKDGIDIRNITLKTYGSEMQTSGFYSSDGKADLRTSVNLIVDSVKNIFSLKSRGEGKIAAKGDVRFSNGAPFIDIRFRGGFYLQTLMELLKVKERVEGWVDVDGRISGAIPKITGDAEVRLKNGNLFGVDVNLLKCRAAYSDGIMSFKEGRAVLYNGRAEAEASLKIPVVDHYSLKVNFRDVDSPAALKLIGWQPEIPEGKVRGEVYTSGKSFNPSGWFDYESRKSGKDVLGRIRTIKGSFNMQDNVISLENTEARTEKSRMDISGTIDLEASALNLRGRLETVDATDLTTPYFNKLTGSGTFTGTVTGKSADPLISGTVSVFSSSFDDYPLENISGVISYKKNLLAIKEAEANAEGEHHAIRGEILFPEAKKIFELKKPDFRLSVSLRGADIEKLARIFYRKIPVKGRIDSDFKITGMGPTPEYSGTAEIGNAVAYGLPVESVSANFSYNYKDIVIKKAVVKNKDSALYAEGRISGGERFSFEAHSDKIFLKDAWIEGVPDDAVLSMKADGSGTFENPLINLEGRLDGGKFKGKALGSGSINASIRNKDILFNSLLFNGKMKIKGKAYFNDILPWSAEIEMMSGRYDFILSSLLKDVPEDLLVNIKGRAALYGDKKNLHASATVEQLNASLYGYGFSNDSDIRLKVENRNVAFSSFTMRSGNASFSLRGNLEIGREYNIVLEGRSELAPLKGLSKRISVLRGDADFTLNVSGKWDDPKINGSLSVANASFGLKDFHQRISSIYGYVYFEEDRIIMQRLSGKLGGGNIDVSGLIYMKGFSIKRFYAEAKLSNITTTISKDFSINFNGDVIYKGTPDSQNVTGEVKVNRARYRERVEWKSWLLKARAKEKPKGELTRIEKAALNVKISGSDNIVVDNNIARTFLKVDLVLRGTVGHPLLFGRVESKGGKVYFRNNEFAILSANADFADPNRINPIMEIVAQTIVKGYNIKLSLEGQFEHFNLSLISDPPLEETDILSLLTVGQVGRELKGLEGGIGAGEAASFLTGKMQDILEERVRNLTGLDRIEVDPYVSKTTGTVGPRVSVSKRLLGDRLFVTYVSSVGSTEEQIIRLEYLLGRNVSLVGMRDDKGSVGGDIKFRFEFK